MKTDFPPKRKIQIIYTANVSEEERKREQEQRVSFEYIDTKVYTEGITETMKKKTQQIKENNNNEKIHSMKNVVYLNKYISIWDVFTFGKST